MNCSLCNNEFISIESLGEHIYISHLSDNVPSIKSNINDILCDSDDDDNINNIIYKITNNTTNVINNCVICYQNKLLRKFICCKNGICKKCIYKYINYQFNNKKNITCIFCRKTLFLIKDFTWM
jgi:hypothetical protein